MFSYIDHYLVQIIISCHNCYSVEANALYVALKMLTRSKAIALQLKLELMFHYGSTMVGFTNIKVRLLVYA